MTRALLSGLFAGMLVALALGVLLESGGHLFELGGRLRQTMPVWPGEPYLPLQLPLVLDRGLAGACWGLLVGLVVRTGRLPVASTSAFVGGVLCTALGYSVLVDPWIPLGSRFGAMSSGDWWPQALVNGVWGWLTGLLMIAGEALRIEMSDSAARLTNRDARP
jgi:hypothetical protein